MSLIKPSKGISLHLPRLLQEATMGFNGLALWWHLVDLFNYLNVALGDGGGGWGCWWVAAAAQFTRLNAYKTVLHAAKRASERSIKCTVSRPNPANFHLKIALRTSIIFSASSSHVRCVQRFPKIPDVYSLFYSFKNEQRPPWAENKFSSTTFETIFFIAIMPGICTFLFPLSRISQVRFQHKEASLSWTPVICDPFKHHDS